MTASMYEKMEPFVNKATGEVTPAPVNKETGETITNPFKLAKISNAANKECKEYMSNMWKEAQKQKPPEQKQEQAQSRGGRGR
jgi:hypothetical protein